MLDEQTALVAETWGIVIGLLFVALIVGSVMWVLLRAARQVPTAMITISLSVLTLVALAGFISTKSETLGAIAASGVGALGGALTALFQAPTEPTERPPQPRNDEEAPDDPPHPG